jgi:hypothetical protein
MNLDFSQFKKVKEDEKSAILKHPRGHHITIAKKALSKKLQGELSQLPMHMDEGGEVPEQPKEQNPNPNQPTIVINTGTQAQAQPAPSYNSAGPGSYTFDPNQFALERPEIPVENKIRAMGQVQQQESIAAQNKVAAMKKAQEDYQNAISYNQMAAQRGLPQVPMPASPPMMEGPQVRPASLDGESFLTQGQMANQPAPQHPIDPFGTQSYQNAYQAGLNEQKQGIQQEANALTQQGKEQEQLYGNAAQQQQAHLQDYQNHYKALEEERGKFLNDLENQHIDPQRFIKNMSVGGKIMTALGLVLSGAGSGLAHQENLANKFLNQQIDNDIQAQRSEMDKKNNMLHHNMEQFHNLRDATDMTRVMMTDMISNQLKQSAAKAMSPLAKSRALQLAGQLDMQAAPVLSQIAMRKSMTDSMQSGRMDPSMTIRMMVPENQQQAAYKELGEAQEQVKGRDAALQAFDELNKVNTIGGRITSPVQTPKQAAALRNNLSVQLARAAAGRVNEYEFEAAKQLFPAPGDDDQTVKIKRQSLMHFIQEKMNTPILSSYGINIGNVPVRGRYNDAGQKKIQLGPPQLAGVGSKDTK